jgi:hypothetical protein
LIVLAAVTFNKTTGQLVCYKKRPSLFALDSSKGAETRLEQDYSDPRRPAFPFGSGCPANCNSDIVRTVRCVSRSSRRAVDTANQMIAPVITVIKARDSKRIPTISNILPS